MKKISVIVFLLGLTSAGAYAQKIGQIKKKSSSNSQRRSSERRSSGSGGSSGCGGDFNGEGCFDVFSACLDLLNLFGSSNNSGNDSQTSTYTPLPSSPPVEKTTPRVENKPEEVAPPKTINNAPPVISNTAKVDPTLPRLKLAERRNYLQVKASYGALPVNYQVFRPGVRVRLGKKGGFGMAFSYRYNFLSEKILNERTTFFTHDVQFLQFAPEVGNNVELRIGAGFMIDENQEYYPEFLFGVNAQPGAMKWNFGTTLRLANDFSTSTQSTARLEWGSHVQYALVNQPKFKLYGGLRTKLASYFGTVNIWSIGVGLNMRIY